MPHGKIHGPSVRGQMHLHLPGSTQIQNVYYLDLLITGRSKKESFQFTKIPVVVATLGRRLLNIGRRGVLERLKVELDFPRSEIVLTRSPKRHKKYPNLAEEIASLDSIISTIDSGQPTAAILQLSWEIEQFIDRLITESEDLRHAQTSSLARNRTLADNLFTNQFPDIARACERLPPGTLVDGEIVALDD
jgi:hypothetical protein